jgi:hypothetical protein
MCGAGTYRKGFDIFGWIAKTWYNFSFGLAQMLIYKYKIPKHAGNWIYKQSI